MSALSGQIQGPDCIDFALPGEMLGDTVQGQEELKTAEDS